jgi:hypothetical protein
VPRRRVETDTRLMKLGHALRATLGHGLLACRRPPTGGNGHTRLDTHTGWRWSASCGRHDSVPQDVEVVEVAPARSACPTVTLVGALRRAGRRDPGNPAAPGRSTVACAERRSSSWSCASAASTGRINHRIPGGFQALADLPRHPMERPDGGNVTLRRGRSNPRPRNHR